MYSLDGQIAKTETADTHPNAVTVNMAFADCLLGDISFGITARLAISIAIDTMTSPATMSFNGATELID